MDVKRTGEQHRGGWKFLLYENWMAELKYSCRIQYQNNEDGSTEQSLSVAIMHNSTCLTIPKITRVSHSVIVNTM